MNNFTFTTGPRHDDYSPDIHDQMAAEQAMAMQDVIDRRHAIDGPVDVCRWLESEPLPTVAEQRLDRYVEAIRTSSLARRVELHYVELLLSKLAEKRLEGGA